MDTLIVFIFTFLPLFPQSSSIISFIIQATGRRIGAKSIATQIQPTAFSFAEALILSPG
jgi:hypothetical protein